MLEVYRTARRPVQTAEQIEQGALSGSRFADNRDPLTLRDGELHLPENHELVRPGSIRPGETGAANESSVGCNGRLDLLGCHYFQANTRVKLGARSAR